MTYKTIQANFENSKVILPKYFTPPASDMKVLITFIDDENENDFGLHEINDNQVTDEFRNLSDNVLLKDKKSFTNI